MAKKINAAEALEECKALDAEYKELTDLHDHARYLGFTKDVRDLETQINARDRRISKLADTYNLWGKF